MIVLRVIFAALLTWWAIGLIVKAQAEINTDTISRLQNIVACLLLSLAYLSVVLNAS